MANLKLTYRIAVFLVDLISKSWRIKIVQGKIPDKGIVVFWHGYMLPVWYVLKNKRPIAVVSQSKDGEILSSLLIKWLFTLIRGSSSKDGREVLNEVTLLAKDNLIAMTPDGPRGPSMTMKPGAVVASVRSGAPVFLLGVKIHQSFTFKRSWDNFKLPCPFSKIEISISDPFINDINLTNEQITDRIKVCELELQKLYD